MLAGVDKYPQVLINVRLAELGDWRNARLANSAGARDATWAGSGGCSSAPPGTGPVLRDGRPRRDQAPHDKATGARINYQSVGSGAGIKQIKAKTVDFGASDAPLKDDDLAWERPAAVPRP